MDKVFILINVYFITLISGLLISCDVEDQEAQVKLENPLLEDEFKIVECEGLNGSDMPCYWRYIYDDTLCSASAPCDKLVIYYSGGGMTCDEGFSDPEHNSNLILQDYASDAYIAVCANIHLDKVEKTFLSEAQRVDLIQKAITNSETIKSIWTGKNLLISGVSHGATAPVIAMANTDYDEGDAWKGTQKTAACFLDGVYDMESTNTYFELYSPQCNLVRKSLICNRYFDGDCSAVDTNNPDLQADRVSHFSADNFSIKNWKLIECGSTLPGCSGDSDWIPAEPITELCTNISAGENHSCINDPIPNEGHLTCATGSGATMCRLWFNELDQFSFL